MIQHEEQELQVRGCFDTLGESVSAAFDAQLIRKVDSILELPSEGTILEPKQKSKTDEPDDKSVNVVAQPGKSRNDVIAGFAVKGMLSNADTLAAFSKSSLGKLDLSANLDALHEFSSAAQSGDLSNAEAMLAAQAAVLNAIFGELARRSALNTGTYLSAAERYMRLALKAQTQCRATLETLSRLKNPSTVYTTQANFSAGHQQVNNGIFGGPSHCEGNCKTSKNKLLGSSDAERNLDT